MSLTETQIAECVARYKREYDRYAKMAEYVYRKCIELVEKKLTIRATVQRRTKSPQSLADKLRRNKDKYSSVEDVFARIGDLAAVRIATYVESDRKPVVQELVKIFAGKGSEEPVVEEKDQNLEAKHYRATHCQIFLSDYDLSEENMNLEATTCEIQVCSLLAHVFNEIEHDLGYKPYSGELTSSEKSLIEQLGLITKSGDITIRRLLELIEARQKQGTGEFEDQYDFIVRMRDKFDQAHEFSSNAGQLYEELFTFGLNSPDLIEQALLADNETLETVGKTEMQKLDQYLLAYDADLLEPNSSDILLFVLLRKRVDDVIANHPAGRGLGRPSRLASIARHYRNMLNTTSNTEAPAGPSTNSVDTQQSG